MPNRMNHLLYCGEWGRNVRPNAQGLETPPCMLRAGPDRLAEPQVPSAPGLFYPALLATVPAGSGRTRENLLTKWG
jgi:hypothetical protein